MAPRVLGWLLRGVRAGERKLLSRQFDVPASLTLASADFEPGATIPHAHWAAGLGENRSPQLSMTSLPAATRSIVLAIEDPDAPMSMPFVHALAFWPAKGGADLASDALAVSAKVPGLVKGKNSAGGLGYYGPAPLVGHGIHRYAFQAFALNSDLGLPAGFDRAALLAAMNACVLAAGSLTAICERR